jgi:hypothetical protein
MVASKYGYLEVVKTLLKDEDLVKCELTDRAQEMRRRDRQGIFDDVPSDNDEPPSNFTLARQEVDMLDEEFTRPWGPREATRAPITAEEAVQHQEEYTQRKCKQVRCASCRDMITLYSYIGEEIPDVPTLISVIDALRALGFMSMDDIQDHWDKVRDELREKGIKKGGDDVKIELSLLAQLSEARHNYGSWSEHFKDEDKLDEETKNGMRKFCCSTLGFGGTLVYATLLSLIVLVPAVVLVLLYDLVHYEEQLWWECFVWLCFFGLGQIVAAFWAAPFIGWGMIKEASRDTDLGATLKGSMNMQGLVSTFLFSTIMGKLQVGLNFDLTATSNATTVSSYFNSYFDEPVSMVGPNAADYTFAEYALKQW